MTDLSPLVLETYGDQVRRASIGEWVVVQQLIDGEWADKARFNEMSDDYAYTRAATAARRLAHQLQRSAA